MKTEKIQKCFIDYGCGFPVVLKNVPMTYVRETWTPNIDYNELHEKVFIELMCKPIQLTRNQVEFILHFFGMPILGYFEKGNCLDICIDYINLANSVK